MSATSARLLQTAAGILGGEDALARHLGIGDVLLAAYLEDRRPLPDYLLLRAVDVVLDHTRKTQTSLPRADLPPVAVQVGKQE